MIFLLVEARFGDEEGKIGVGHAKIADFDIEPILDVFPNVVAPGAEDVASRNVVVGDHFGEDNDVGVPHGEILFFFPLKGQEGFAFFRGSFVAFVLFLLFLLDLFLLFGLFFGGEVIKNGFVWRRVYG